MKNIFIYLLFAAGLYAHPVNLTKMDLNLSDKTLHLRFVSYNMEKVFGKEFENVREIEKEQKNIAEYTKRHLLINGCRLEFKKLEINNEIVIDEYFFLNCKPYLSQYKIFFDMFFKQDDSQTGVMKVTEGKKEYVLNFNTDNTTKVLQVNNSVSFLSFVYTGVMHILEGADHLTFLLVLLLPAILFNNSKKKTLKDILIIATAFSVSHSVSLMLSAFSIIEFDPRIIEILITVTIMLTAINNVFHFISYKKEWLIAFLFGFIHGFAFSEALRDLNLNFSNFLKVVLGFNLGVELGQVIVIILALPVLFTLIKKEKKIYLFLNFLALTLSVLWFTDRFFDAGFMPF